YGHPFPPRCATGSGTRVADRLAHVSRSSQDAGMDFFESLPEPAPQPPETEETRAGTGIWRRPSAVLGGSAAVDLMMIHTEDGTCALRDFHAFTNGFEFTMHVVSRVPETGARAPSAPPLRPSENLRLGLRYADGRRGAKGRLSMHFPPPPGEVLISKQGGSG